MQYLINLLGRFRFNWIDLLCIYLFSDLIQKGQVMVAVPVLVVGGLLSFAAYYHVKD